MIFQTKEITLKDGRKATLRSPEAADAAQALEYLKITAAETPFLLRTPEEVILTEEKEAKFLNWCREDPSTLPIYCFVDGVLAGNCQLSRKTKRKNCHRGTIGIALCREFWNLGIGSAMFREMIAAAESWGLLQLELEVIEGNDRGIALYKKFGFETVGYTPNAIRMEDGRFVKEFLMVKSLLSPAEK